MVTLRARIPWLVLALAPALASASAPAPTPAQQAGRLVTDDANLRVAWDGLPKERRREALEWLALEVAQQDSLSARLIEHALATAPRDGGAWPEQGAIPYYDPAVHAPAQPIPRRRLAPDAEAARAVLERCARVRPPRRMQSRFAYDWASGEPRRIAGADPLAVGFENALLGHPPDADLAYALCLAALDTGEQRVALAGFAHAYTDREGNVFPITLYDAWSSGLEIEMPDVDALGIAHEVLLEPRRWTAPIPREQHADLYARIAARFEAARPFRGLREALAACWIGGDPVLWDGFGETAPELHALWVEHAATPAKLADALPREPDAHRGFLAEWSAACQKDTMLRRSGLDRQAALRKDAQRVRETFTWVLQQLGAFDAAAPAVAAGAAPSAPSADAPAPAAVRDEPTAEALRDALAAFARKKPSERARLEDALRAAVAASPARQAAQVQAAIAGVDREKLPKGAPPGPHDGRAYGGPARRKVAPSARAWRALQEEIAPPGGAARDPLCAYDFGAREVRRREPAKGEEARLFEEALAGVAPDTDLAEALVIARIDRDSTLQKEAAFFFHDYADLSSNAFAGISLFDVWSHEIPIDVPDVDVRAYAELVWDRRDLPAPLSAADQAAWYPRMAASLHALRRHVLPARATAAVWFRARPPLEQGYAESVDTLHALIALENEDPGAVADRFRRLGAEVVETTLGEIESRGAAAWNAGNARRDALLAGEAHVRAAAIAVLAEAGLLE